MFDQMNEISAFELFRSLPYYIAVLLPLVIILSPPTTNAAIDFPVYRLQHFDLQGIKYGSRSSVLNFESRSIETRNPARKCIIMKVQEFSTGRFRELINEGIGALLIVLPSDLDSLSDELKENILEAENFLLSQEILIPVYFTYQSSQLDEIYASIKESTMKDSATSAAQALLGAVFANGYQLAVNGNQAKLLPDQQITNIQGKLPGFSMEELPVVAVVAHYDAFGAAPDLAFGSDSNASGVAALLEIVRLLSRLASQPNQTGLPRFNLAFFLTGGGKLNFLGSKKVLEDQLDSVDGGLFQDTIFALCLDSLGNGDELNVHVSKPPKEGSNIGTFVKNLQDFSGVEYPDLEVNVMHKKINLADDFLAWEHERYSIRRLNAMTVSHYKNAKSDVKRGTILDTKSSVSTKVLARNVQLIAEALASQLYNTSGPFFVGDMAVSEEMLNVWLTRLGSLPRFSSSLGSKGSSNIVVNMLQQTMQRYLTDVKVTHLTADKRDPEFGFYDQSKGVLTAYNVKPAIFDLFLTGTIVAYLAIIYYGVQIFEVLWALIITLAMKLAKSEDFVTYQKQVVKNAQELSRGLQELGYKVVTGGTDNHLILMDLRSVGLTGGKGEKILEEIGVACNKNTVPGDKSALNPSGIRLGTPALTTRGFLEADIRTLVNIIHQGLQLAHEVSAISGPKLVDFKRVLSEDAGIKVKVDEIRAKVESLALAFPMPGYEF
uniref:BOS complex subunit NCLN n=1 Tax=Alona affinis TaxID=381656 RepID=A0A9N6ZEQ1_9CRUS|nr:EOG090X02MW [Alona affinis]